MLTSSPSPSPTTFSLSHRHSPTATLVPSPHCDGSPRRIHSSRSSPKSLRISARSPREAVSSSPRTILIPTRSTVAQSRTVDAGTQYSPLLAARQSLPTYKPSRSPTTASSIEKRRRPSDPPLQPSIAVERPPALALEPTVVGAKPSTSNVPIAATPKRRPDADSSATKRAKPANPAVKVMPLQYETCDVKDLVILIANMIMELVRFNDEIPLRDGGLTRFHSRAPPGISVIDYLQRLTTHATLSPPILLSMVYYIDRLCALYPAFTISSLTVHRFLIASATVASKGLSDSFWTNSTYARVGGVSLKELALLELEFLWRVEWKIVPKPEILVEYYKSLVERNDGYIIDGETHDGTGKGKSIES